MDLNFRTLKADEIEVRVGATDNKEKKWISLLLYKNARVDMDILDETVGKTNWQRHHLRDNANCVVSIYDNDKHEWVSKEDTGTESNTEAKKGQASDSFKRACVNWGIGRELYTAPKIFIYGSTDVLKKDNYHVSSITYSIDKKITGLTIVNKSGAVVYTLKNTQITPAQVQKLQIILKKLGDKYKDAVYKQLKINSCKELSFDKANELIKTLSAKVEEKKGQ